MAPPKRLNIPTAQRNLRYLTKLDAASFEGLSERLQRADPGTSIGRFARAISEDAADEQVPGIVAALVGIRRAIDDGLGTTKDVATALGREAVTLGLISSDESHQLSDRLTKLLDLRTVALTARPFVLLGEHDHPFAQVRIVTDVRPLFLGDEKEPVPSASMIVHKLKIEDRSGDSYVSLLAPEDLKSLQRAVERAIKKEAALRQQLESSVLSALTAEESESK